MNNFALTFILVPVLFFFSSCGNSKLVCDPPPAPDPGGNLSGPTANLNVDVYIDGTVSMEGFAMEGTLSQYQQTIPMLERAVIKSGGQISFSKFGTDVVELPGRSYGDADRKPFYRDGRINTKTLIEKVIDRAKLDDLTIIVTDLFQEKADINQLTEKIKTKFLSADRAVGIMGIRSAYKGKIFDVGIHNYNFDYGTTQETKSYRPFYLLALGKTADISRYFDTLIKGEMTSFPETNQVIFSKYLGETISTLAGSKVTDTQGVNEVNGVLVKAQKGEQPYREFRVKANAASPSVSMSVPFHSLSSSIAFEQLRSETEAFSCGAIVADGNAAPASKASNEGSGALGLPELALQEGLIKLKMTVDPKKLDNKLICGYHIVLRPAKFQLPGWLSEWDLSGAQVESFHTTPASFDGSKTYNLVPFIETLWEANRSVNNPKVADFYTYFKLG